MKYGLIPEFIGRLPVDRARSTSSRRDDLITILTEPRNALDQAVPALLRVRRHRARLRRRLARRDRRQGARARDRRPRPALDHRGDPARRAVRAALAPRREEVRRHQGDDRAGPAARRSSPRPRPPEARPRARPRPPPAERARRRPALASITAWRVQVQGRPVAARARRAPRALRALAAGRGARPQARDGDPREVARPAAQDGPAASAGTSSTSPSASTTSRSAATWPTPRRRSRSRA